MKFLVSLAAFALMALPVKSDVRPMVGDLMAETCITQKGVSTLNIPSTVHMRDFGPVQTVELSLLDVFFVNHFWLIPFN